MKQASIKHSRFPFSHILQIKINFDLRTNVLKNWKKGMQNKPSKHLTKSLISINPTDDQIIYKT